MPLEKSTLSTDTIRALLAEHYGLSLLKALPLAHGSANCYCVFCGKDRYFLKEYQSSFTQDDLQRETQLVSYLVGHGFPTAAILPARNGARFLRINDRFITLQSWIEGKTYTQEALPPALLLDSAKRLGQLHVLLNGYALPLEMDSRWVAAFSPQEAARQYDELLFVLSKNPDDPHCERIRHDLLCKKELCFSVADFKKYFSGITYGATHGDYNALQFVCGKEHINAIIDFSSAGTLPLVWEIMRCYVQSSLACKDGAAFDIDGLCDYVAAYLQCAPLTKRDLAAMPYVYLFQLARSKYGYREYLIKNSANRESLLDFAFWRTDIFRQLFKECEEISLRLTALKT